MSSAPREYQETRPTRLPEPPPPLGAGPPIDEGGPTIHERRTQLAATRGDTAGPSLNGRFLERSEGEAEAFDSDALTRAFRLRRAGALPAPGTPGVELQAGSLGDPPRQELVLGTSNLLPFDFLRTGDRVGRAVVKIVRGDGATGTGFLVAPDVLLTNHHVLPDEATASAARGVANHERMPPEDSRGRPAVVPLCPSDLFVTDEELDFTFCGVRGLDHIGSIALERNSFNVMKSELVNIVQHPRGRPKEVALQDNQVIHLDNAVVRYSCDTEPGSSGSPVFNNQWELVALHHASVAVDDSDPQVEVPGSRGRLKFLNEGIRLSAIALWLDSHTGNPGPLADAVERLRSIFRGCDPRAGLFGGLGRVARRGERSTHLVETYRRDSTFDVAYWELPGGNVLSWDRLDALAWSIAELGLDAWCFSGLGEDEAHRLCGHLSERFRLEFQARTRKQRGRSAQAPLTVILPKFRSWHFLTPDADPREADAPWLVRVESTKGGGRRLGILVSPSMPLVGSTPSNPWPGPPVDPKPWIRRIREGLDRDGCREDAVLLGRTAPAMPDALADIRGAGWVPRCSALGPSGGLVVLSGTSRRVERIVLGPNLVPILRPTGELAFSLPRDRDSLEPMPGLGEPLPLRLVFGPDPVGTPSGPELGDSGGGEDGGGAYFNRELEEALQEWIVPFVRKLVDEYRGHRPEGGD